MTLRISLAAGVAAVLAAIPAQGAPQRARVHAEASSTAANADVGEQRQARPREERTATPRPVRDESATAPAAASIVAPTVKPSTPSATGNALNGKRAETSPGAGHGDRDDDDRHHHNSRHDRKGKTDVFVPVFVPVAVPVEVAVEEPVLTYTAPSATVASVSNPATYENRADQAGRYYVFTPWFDIGTALVAGVPFVLPPPETFEEGNSSSLVLEPDANASAAAVTAMPLEYARGIGGVAFNVQPGDAAIYVDGYFVGSVDDYADGREPLLVNFGAYLVELRANGYVTEKFPVYVTMGEVIPLRGKLVKRER
jgi:hypothetical protein